MPPPVQHIMTSLSAPNLHSPVLAHQVFQEPAGLSEVAFRDVTAFVLPTPLPYPNELTYQGMPRGTGSAFLDMNDFDHQANVTGPNHFNVHPMFGAIDYTLSVEFLHAAPRFGPDGQETWARHEYSDRSSDPMLGLTQPNLNQRCMRENLVQFGSDLRFARDRFEAPDHHPTEAGLRATMLGQVRGLFTKGDVGGERPSSLDVNGPQPQPGNPLARRTDLVSSPALAPESEGYGSPIQEHSQSSSTKPRAAAAKRGNSTAFSPPAKPATRGRKSKGKRHTNLSNEQRVDNHRQSEQRRRDEIRNSYVAMKATIPGMGDKKTKGAEMQYTVTWMRQTLKENEELVKLLESVTKGN
ncbi:MAG: hypothetical protein Q9168_002787 [Polycauliona sp. 1 TL-2023]